MIGPQRYTNGQQAYDELLNSANDQGNAHQNRHEISPHTCLMATIKKKTENNKCWQGCREIRTIVH